MIVKKKNRDDFYTDLRRNFPEIGELEVWIEYDLEKEPYLGAPIMIAVAEKTIQWAINDQLELVHALLKFFELSYKDYSDEANAYIYTDFHPTIITLENDEVRDSIKQCMGERTKSLYDQLIKLGFYVEN